MHLEQFRAFSQQLKTNLEKDTRVLGLVFLGSSAEQGRIPDAYSDHDFFVITMKGVQEAFRQNLDWLPDAVNVVIKYRETEHGLKVVFANGHLIEFAIFDEDELFYARVNDYRVDLDKANIRELLQKLEAISNSSFNAEHALYGFFCETLIGVRRCQRGEIISGNAFIKQYGFLHLMKLLCHYIPAENKDKLDNLNPVRRFEAVFPELGREINAAILLDGEACAQRLLAIADRELGDRMPDYPSITAELIKKFTT